MQVKKNKTKNALAKYEVAGITRFCNLMNMQYFFNGPNHLFYFNKSFWRIVCANTIWYTIKY